MRTGKPAAILLLTLLASCAHPPGPAPARPAPPSAKATPPPLKISADLAQLETKLEHTKPGDKVSVPARLLKGLVSRERRLRERCAALDDQLQALKNVDLEGTEE